MPPPPSVGVVTATPGEAELVAELPGRTEASRVAQVRARATGVVLKRLFTEGSDVKAGAALFQIDAAPYAASADAARATIARAEAALAQAEATLERNKALVDAKAISQQEWVATQAAHKQAAADLASAQAAHKTAAINLGYTSVRSPIAGRVGRALVTEGALVSATEATQLATVQQIDPLYINFTQSAGEALRLKKAFEAGALKRSGGAAQVQVVLDDGSVHPTPAKLLFSDLTVDAGTGQVTLRAELPNPGGALLPGLFVRVRMPQGQTEGAILLPQQAVTRGAGGDTVLVVNPEDKQVGPRPVKVAAGQGNQWIVLEGLKAGEQVVVDGFQKIRPKSPVNPVPWSPNGAAPAASGASASAPEGGAAAPAASAASAASR